MITLDVFATSDLHGNVLQFDYVRMAPTQRPAFVQLGNTIRDARANSTNSLLFDNGDLIQGTAFADTLIENRKSGLNMHSFLGLCSYDAATLGNHDLDYGAEVLNELIETASCPYVCANIEGAPFTLPPQFVILDRIVMSTTGNAHPLRIGVTGCLPQQSQNWSQLSMQGKFVTKDPVQAVQTAVRQMIAQGADICIVLAHSGYTTEHDIEDQGNIARGISEIAGVDAVIAGHIHSVFAKDQTAEGAAAIVMPGCHGTHLGHIQLGLEADGLEWKRQRGSAKTIECVPFQTGDSDIFNTAQNNHRETLARLGARVGQTRYPINSFFGRIAPCNAAQFIHDAQLWQLGETLEGTEFQNLPRLSSTCLPRTGGSEGAENYSFLPSGPVNLHNLHDLYPFENQFCALILSGAEVRAWLERAASSFNTLELGAADQPLLNPKVPGYDFDTIGGLEYEIDLSRPAAFDHSGHPLLDVPDRNRISKMLFNGKEVADAQKFAVATNGHRRSRYADAICIEGQINTRNVLINYLSRRQVIDPSAKQNWAFKPMPQTSGVFDTSPLALKNGKPPINVTYVGPAPKGFSKFRRTF